MSNNKVRANDHESYTICTLVGFLIPFAGFIIGAIMLTKDSKLDRKLGEHTIVVSILGLILAAIVWVVWANSVAVGNIEMIDLQ